MDGPRILLWYRHPVVMVAQADCGYFSDGDISRERHGGGDLPRLDRASRSCGWLGRIFRLGQPRSMQRLSFAHHEATGEQLGSHHQRRLPIWAAIVIHPLRIGLMNLPWSAVALFSLVPGFMGVWNERAGDYCKPCTAGPGRT